MLDGGFERRGMDRGSNDPSGCLLHAVLHSPGLIHCGDHLLVSCEVHGLSGEPHYIIITGPDPE